MSDISGLIPYQNLSVTAKANGGPDQFIRYVYNKGFVDGARAANINSCADIYLWIGVGIGAGAALVIGSWICKQIKTHRNSKYDDTE